MVFLISLVRDRRSSSPARSPERSATRSGSATRPSRVWNIAKWPVICSCCSLIVGVLYYAAPNVKQPVPLDHARRRAGAARVGSSPRPGSRSTSANFGSYHKTYGTLGGVIVFLVWLWMSNIALLLGAELNAELERGRELEAGLPAEDDLQLPPRTAPSSS